MSHRGYWRESSEKNTLTAFRTSLTHGYGTETDFRDSSGELVIAHDLPGHFSLRAEALFRLYSEINPSLPIAINIKADGLQVLLKSALTHHGIKNYFLFDMSVPDAIISIKHGLRVYTRQSDVEPQPAFYPYAAGVWMDAFFDDSWLTPISIELHLRAGKQVCLVSPELHNRPHLGFWERLKCHTICQDNNLILCTDQPQEATAFFHND
jgi:hypothetical protein